MIIKYVSIRAPVKCDYCKKYLLPGHECISILDYMGEPYLDKYFCSKKHYLKTAFWEHKPFKFDNDGT